MDQSLDVLDQEITLLQGVAMLNVLPLPAIEQLARVLEPLEVAAGETVFDQGDLGDRYFVIESGEAEVLEDGRMLTTVGAGQGFGEIALVRQVPRTASVRATSALRLHALRSEHFVAVVCGFAPSSHVAVRTVDSLMDPPTPRSADDDPTD
jgi:CRP-like cAMP-binding protein